MSVSVDAPARVARNWKQGHSSTCFRDGDQTSCDAMTAIRVTAEEEPWLGVDGQSVTNLRSFW